ncbi:MAG TPA: tRNA lysidine(34) synthetase TilS [Solirubrobacterales bacterium]|nr:tRNA lysidine(34) synthetase TilS [Solirubrobacterales bacterium]
MPADQGHPALARAVRESGLIAEGTRGVVLVSGGADSAATAAGLVELLGPEAVTALHLNYGLRTDSDRDEETARELGARLEIEVEVERPVLGEGNVQAEAREARYRSAERLRRARGVDWIATGHTRTDLAETVLYRLVTSPGRRALLGLQPRRGPIVRPLLSLDRDQVRRLASDAGLPFRDDPSNVEPLFARNRVRNEVLPVLREIGPAEATIAETQAELAEEGEALDRAVAEALAGSGAEAAGAISRDALAPLHPAVRRLALRRLAERTAGRPVALGRVRAEEIWRLVNQPEGGVVQLGGGVEAQVEGGHVRFTTGPTAEPAAATLSVPGVCRFGSWEVRAELAAAVPPGEGPDRAVLDPGALGGALVVRSWREGDRMRPLGLQGSKSLQDLFTDRKVPRSLRHALPVVTSDGRIVWIAGVAVSAEFAAKAGAVEAAVLSAAQVPT